MTPTPPKWLACCLIMVVCTGCGVIQRNPMRPNPGHNAGDQRADEVSCAQYAGETVKAQREAYEREQRVLLSLALIVGGIWSVIPNRPGVVEIGRLYRECMEQRGYTS